MQYASAPVECMQLDDPASRPTRGFIFSQATARSSSSFHDVVDGLLRKMLVRGFHGEVMVKFIVHDGTIELIEECVRRMHR